MVFPVRIIWILTCAVVFGADVRGQAPIPMRVTLQSGLSVAGCGSLVARDSLKFSPQPLPRKDSLTLACVQGTPWSPLGLAQLRSVQVPQAQAHVGAPAIKGALLGALAGGGLYWTTANTREQKKCKKCLLDTPTDWAVAGAITGGAVGAFYGALHPTISWTSVIGNDANADQAKGVFDWLLRYAKVDGTAGAGFAGIRVAEVLRTRAADTTYFPVVNYRYDWRPAVSTGVVTYLYTSKASQLGVGLGAQIVALPTSDGKAPPFPAITLHVGVPQTEFFAGLVLSPTDSIALPDTSGPLGRRISNSTDPRTFIVPNVRTSRHVYIGIQIKGTRKGISDLGIPENSEVVFDVDATEGDSIRLRAHLQDANGNSLAAPQPQFTVAYGSDSVVIIDNAWLKPRDNTSGGFAVVRAQIGSKEAFQRLVVRPKADTTHKTTSDSSQTHRQTQPDTSTTTPAATTSRISVGDSIRFSGFIQETSKAPLLPDPRIASPFPPGLQSPPRLLLRR